LVIGRLLSRNIDLKNRIFGDTPDFPDMGIKAADAAR